MLIVVNSPFIIEISIKTQWAIRGVKSSHSSNVIRITLPDLISKNDVIKKKYCINYNGRLKVKQ